MTIRSIALTCTAVVFTTVVYGQGIKTGLVINVGKTAIKPEKAEEARVGEQAWLFQIGFNLRVIDLIDFSGGLGLISLGDHGKFSQSTTAGTKSSTTGGLNAFFEGGIVPSFMVRPEGDKGFPKGFALGIRGGKNYFDATRHIPNCFDCDGEDLPIRGGWYWRPTFLIFMNSTTAVGAVFTRYTGSSDMKSDWMITLRTFWE